MTPIQKQVIFALEDAIRQIQDEYCSHGGEHGGDTCYARDQIHALEAYRKFIEENQGEHPRY